MLILVAEDDEKTSSFLRTGLREAGHVVDVVSDGEEAMKCICCRDYDLVVLDLMLPKRDGWNVLKELRKAGNEMPVLLLTARDEIADQVRGWISERTITWSSLSPLANCLHESVHLLAAEAGRGSNATRSQI